MEKPAITRINGGFEIVANPKSNENNGFYLPRLSTEQRDALENVGGLMIFHNNNNAYEVAQNGNWYQINRTLSTPTIGAGLAPGSAPIVLPIGEAIDVQVAANEVKGFIYYDSTSETYRAYQQSGWVAVTV